MIPDVLLPHFWWIMAFIGSFATASVALVSQYHKVEGNITVFWRGVIPCLVITPVLFFIEFPTSPYFYLLAFLTAGIASYTDTKRMNGSILFGAGISLRIRPYALWLIFLLWFLFSTESREQFLLFPMESAIIVLALIVMAIATSYLKKYPLNRQALIYFMPVIVCWALLDFLNKTAMGLSPVLGGIFVYGWIQSMLIAFVCFSKQYLSETKNVSDLFQKKSLKAGIIIGTLFLVLILAKNTAMTFTENPAYVSAIFLCAPIWASIFYKLKREKEETNEFAGLLVVLSSIILVILASNE